MAKSSRAGAKGKSKAKKKNKKKGSSRAGLSAADRKILAAARAALKKPKKAKKAKKATTSRKGSKAAGHKLAKYNRLAAKIGKKAAHAQVYGRSAKGKKAGKKGHKAHHTSRRRSYTAVRNADFMTVLHEIQASHGSAGLPATPSERAQARQAIEMAREAERAYASSHTTSEERIRQQTAATVRHAKLAAAQKILAVEAAAARKAEIERRRAEAKAAVESYAARL